MQAYNRKNDATDQQKSATDPLSSFWVSANAGTGKTKVLVNRIISLIASSVKPSKILCITFTKAGASEMISRISSEARNLLTISSDEFIEYIHNNCAVSIGREQVSRIKKTLISIIDNPDEIRIKTIHSLCAILLKSFPLEAGVVPFFNTADDLQTSKLIEISWKNLLSDLEKREDIYSQSYLELSGLLSSDMIKKNIFSLYEKKSHIYKILHHYNGLDRYINYLRKSFEVDESINLENIFFEKNKEDIEKLVLFLDSGGVTAQKRAKRLKEIIRKFSINSLADEFDVKDLADKEIRKFHPLVDELILKIKSSLNLDLDKINSQKLLSNTKNFLIILDKLLQQYEVEKAKNYFLDYDDLIEKSRELLTNSEFSSWVLYKLDGGVEHILVDEAQDTSPSQWEIIKAFSEEFFSGSGSTSKERTLFVVGDEKQSIFSFQGADLRIFSDVKTHFDLKIRNSKNNLQKIPLSYSFRTLPAILDLVDKVLENKDVSEATSSELTSHIAKRSNNYGYVEIIDIPAPIAKPRTSGAIEWYLANEYEEETVETKRKIILAEKITRKIVDILKNPHVLPRTGKQVQPGDIMILFKKRDELVELITKNLQKEHVPVSGVDKVKISENLAILDIISCAKFLLSKEDDYNLACLLKSAFVNISEESLFKLCYNRGGSSLYHNILKTPENKHITMFLEEITSINFSTPTEFFFKLLETKNYRAHLINYFGINISQIIDEFLQIVKKYESQNTPSMQDFIKWFEKNAGEINRTQDPKTNEVRMITVHSSKGLESPIVFLADANSESLGEYSFVIDNKYILIPASKDYNNAFSRGKFEEQKKRNYQESLRLLYVALTRACDEIYIYGDEKSSERSWHNIVRSAAQNIPSAQKTENNSIIVTNKEYLDFITKQQAIESNARPEEFQLPEFYNKNYQETITENQILPSLLSSKTHEDISVVSASSTDLERGTILHRLLEILPKFPEDKRSMAFDIIMDEFSITDEKIKTEYKEEIFTILNSEKIRFIFEKPSKNEVPISGYVDGKLVNGKIDRIVYDNENIYLIDYKTHKNPENQEKNLVEKYQPQMELYYRLLKHVYPDKKITASLLLTKNCKFLNYNFDE